MTSEMMSSKNRVCARIRLSFFHTALIILGYVDEQVGIADDDGG